MSCCCWKNYLFVGALLFGIGLVGFFARRNMIVMFLSAEMMLQGVSVSLVAWGRYHNDWGGQMLVIFIFTVAACEAAIALAIVLVLFHKSGSLDIVFWQQSARRQPAGLRRRASSPKRAEAEPHWPKLTPAGIEPEPDWKKSRTACTYNVPLNDPDTPHHEPECLARFPHCMVLIPALPAAGGDRDGGLRPLPAQRQEPPAGHRRAARLVLLRLAAGGAKCRRGRHRRYVDDRLGNHL